MIWNRFLVLISIALAVAGCKTQQTIAPLVIRDSISITYKQGTEQPLSLHKIEEQPTPIGVRGAASPQVLCNQPRLAGDNYRSYEVATRYDGKPRSLPNGGGAKSVQSVESVRDIKIRVDTLFVERWHTTEVPSPPKPIPRFYKDCTWGFFILLLLIIGRIALKIWKQFFFHS